MIKETFLDLYHFLNNPGDSRSKLSFKNKLVFIFILLLFELIITALFIIPIEYGIELFIDVRFDKIDYSETIWRIVLLNILLIPFVEELIFRYFLRYKVFKTRFISLDNWKRIFGFLVYVSASLFGLLHITNYDNNEHLFYVLTPFITLSQIFGGLIITFIRVRLSFLYGVIYHILWNFLVIIAIPAIIITVQNPIDITNDVCTLKITEKLFFEENLSQELKIDSLNGKIFEMTINQYSLQHILDTLYNPKTYYIDDVLIDGEFKSENGIEKSKIVDILKIYYDIE
ncbi:CPBP family intramembrane glutamic endopeptidase [Maribacter sp. MAR_2009_72]|uniref:CPBP family intramembrane glutamic endopeptidase n=1 Tax=Maribacter sp. MAR_2009_72 TaxID=1250050 RepID=UPI00119A4BCD|nr:CPBP family intramembrane glutamic endopeptidase [Maribacter sp. MAR_2009_72]TVZ14693.1 CAAX prenyl protease-like protein [Maribacter sp. MAR_2009_72]